MRFGTGAGRERDGRIPDPDIAGILQEAGGALKITDTRNAQGEEGFRFVRSSPVLLRLFAIAFVGIAAFSSAAA